MNENNENEAMLSLQEAGQPTGESSDTARGEQKLPSLPADAMIIVPVRNFVLFPGIVMPISIGRPKSIAAAQQAVRE